MKIKGHTIKEVKPGSIGEELELEPGDRVISINEQEIEDIFDYEFMIREEYLELLAEKPDGEQWLLEIEKEEEEDLGIVFENGLMDEYRSCKNKCMFCFIDQMPKGMRETLYFKDDDSRLSFLQGNYITLTNMSEKDVDRIIKYKLSPINISVHTTNPQLRCEMLHNRFAGEALKKLDRLYEAGTPMNGQIVLCKGVNDREELKRSIEDLVKYQPYMESVSVVPVGLSKFRDGLYPLEAFTKEDARETIDLIEGFQRENRKRFGVSFIHASDEFYVLAERELPKAEQYDGYIQLENGVGMLRLLMNEVEEALKGHGGDRRSHTLSLATGMLAYPFIREAAAMVQRVYPGVVVHVYSVVNHFFGEKITVSGLITGQDLMQQLKGKELGEVLLLPQNMFMSGAEVFLDDITKEEVQKALQVPVNIVKSSGQAFVDAIILNSGHTPQGAVPSYRGYELKEI